MTIYDISQEVFSCQVYTGDPAPQKEVLSSTEKGDLYNLTAFSMCAHNGTHIDAPFHFIRDGKTVDEICLDSLVGMAYVAEHQGIVSGDDAAEIIKRTADPALPGLVTIHQKNKFSVGETIEIMCPDGRDLQTRVLGMWNAEGKAVQSAPHPGEMIRLQLDSQAAPGDILRISRQ